MLAVLSGVVVNLRLLLYSAALGERFAGQPRLFRWLGPHLMIDQTFLMAQSRPELTGRTFRHYWWWLGALVLVVWCSSVAAGELLAPSCRPCRTCPSCVPPCFSASSIPRLGTPPAVTAAVTGFGAAALVSSSFPSSASSPARYAGSPPPWPDAGPPRPVRNEGAAMPIRLEDLTAVVALGLACWVLRAAFVLLVPADRLPAVVAQALQHLAPAALASIVAVELHDAVDVSNPASTCRRWASWLSPQRWRC